MESKHMKAHNEQTRKDNDELGLMTAIHKYQSLKLKSDATGRNSRFKSDENPKGTPYSTLEDAIACANEGLQFGLIFTQSIICEDGQQYLNTVVRHINDTDILRCKYPLFCNNKDNPQAFASTVTYAKRYSLHMLYGFGSIITDDDDANVASPVKATNNNQSNKF
tara:strand:- start:2696 stop:3190 length:495 start_codon:yes stop_codon:yes gene_type:complete